MDAVSFNHCWACVIGFPPGVRGYSFVAKVEVGCPVGWERRLRGSFPDLDLSAGVPRRFHLLCNVSGEMFAYWLSLGWSPDMAVALSEAVVDQLRRSIVRTR